MSVIGKGRNSLMGAPLPGQGLLCLTKKKKWSFPAGEAGMVWKHFVNSVPVIRLSVVVR